MAASHRAREVSQFPPYFISRLGFSSTIHVYEAHLWSVELISHSCHPMHAPTQGLILHSLNLHSPLDWMVKIPLTFKVIKSRAKLIWSGWYFWPTLIYNETFSSILPSSIDAHRRKIFPDPEMVHIESKLGWTGHPGLTPAIKPIYHSLFGNRCFCSY